MHSGTIRRRCVTSFMRWPHVTLALNIHKPRWTIFIFSLQPRAHKHKTMWKEGYFSQYDSDNELNHSPSGTYLTPHCNTTSLLLILLRLTIYFLHVQLRFINCFAAKHSIPRWTWYWSGAYNTATSFYITSCRLGGARSSWSLHPVRHCAHGPMNELTV